MYPGRRTQAAQPAEDAVLLRETLAKMGFSGVIGSGPLRPHRAAARAVPRLRLGAGRAPRRIAPTSSSCAARQKGVAPKRLSRNGPEGLNPEDSMESKRSPNPGVFDVDPRNPGRA